MLTDRLPPAVADEWEWQQRGACRERPDLFFSPEGERGPRRLGRLRRAKQLCGSCPVQMDCRRYALAVGEPFGVWGGLSESERGSRGD